MASESLVNRLCDSPLAKMVGLVSGALGIILFLSSALHRQPADTTKDAAAVATQSPASADRNGAAIPLATRRAATAPHTTIQTSKGSQSPNLSNIKHDVRIQYGSAAMETPKGSPEKVSAASPAHTTGAASTSQTSHGTQSPNVSGVGGSVEIRYGSPAASSEKSAEEQQ